MFKQHILVLGFGLGLVSSACVTETPNGSHCRYAQGDQTCAERYGEARPFCTAAACDSASEGVYGCVAERPSDDCYYPCGGDNDVTVDNGCMFAGDGDGDGGDDNPNNSDDNGDSGGSDTDSPCSGPDDCGDAAAPFCDVDVGVCVGCDGMEDADGACAGFDPELPVCSADVCVACTEDKPGACGGEAPICDAQSNVCVGCSDHAQCPDSACNLDLGSCFDPSTMMHVDGSPGCGDEGTKENPYCTLGEALMKSAEPTVIILYDKGSPYEETVEISTTIALFAASDEPRPVLTGVAGTTAVSVMQTGRLFSRGVDIVGTEDEGLGLEILGGRAWIERSKIVNNSGGGVRVTGDGALVLENCFVGGGAGSDDIIEVVSGDVSAVYSTVGAGSNTQSRAIACAAEGSATIRNSIIVAIHGDPEIACDNKEVIDSITETDSKEDFNSNSKWFVDANNGDFRLDAANYPKPLISGAAKWRSDDPTTDIDGNQRPTADGASDFAGADLLEP